MKKRFFALFSALVILICSMGLTIAYAEEAPDGNNNSGQTPTDVFAPVIKEYERVISMGEDALDNINAFIYVGGLDFGGYYPGTNTVYTFYDINGDGTEEMLIGTGSDSGTRSIIEVFYFEDDKIGKLFDETFNYRVGLHIGADGTVMTEGSMSAFGAMMDVFLISTTGFAPELTNGYYYDTSDMAESFEEYTKLSQNEYTAKVNDYIANGLDYSSLDWRFFVTPPEGEYDPYPKQSSAFQSVAGTYVDTSASQSCVLCDDGSFRLSVNFGEGYYDYVGTYTVSSSGNIDCTLDSGWSEHYGNVIHLNLFDNTLSVLSDYSSLYKGLVFRYAGGFTPDEATGTVTGEGVRIRSGPGTDYNVLTSLSKGSTVTIFGESDGWYRIGYTLYYHEPATNSTVSVPFIGFMSADYIARD